MKANIINATMNSYDADIIDTMVQSYTVTSRIELRRAE